MVVKDTDGQIIIKNPNGEEVRYTAIGLAPSGAGKINTDIPIENYPYGTEHWYTPRQLGLKALA